MNFADSPSLLPRKKRFIPMAAPPLLRYLFFVFTRFEVFCFRQVSDTVRSRTGKSIEYDDNGYAYVTYYTSKDGTRSYRLVHGLCSRQAQGVTCVIRCTNFRCRGRAKMSAGATTISSSSKAEHAHCHGPKDLEQPVSL